MRFKHYNYKITSPTFFFGEFNALGYFTCTDPKQHSVSTREEEKLILHKKTNTGNNMKKTL